MSKAGPSSSGGKTIGCIGKCTSGLTPEELDFITDHIERTLTHNRGRKIFRKYLTQGSRKIDLACLDLYEKCSECIDKERSYRLSTKSPTTENLANDVNEILNEAEELEIPEIDLALLERCTEALDCKSREALLNVIDETKNRLMTHLRQPHKGFRTYAKQPCPRS